MRPVADSRLLGSGCGPAALEGRRRAPCAGRAAHHRGNEGKGATACGFPAPGAGRGASSGQEGRVRPPIDFGRRGKGLAVGLPEPPDAGRRRAPRVGQRRSGGVDSAARPGGEERRGSEAIQCGRTQARWGCGIVGWVTGWAYGRRTVRARECGTEDVPV